jgi:hypothetical protein
LAGVIVIFVALHLLAGAGGVIWLAASDRLSKERFDRVVETFKPTVKDEKKAEEERISREAQALSVQQQVAHLEAVADGPRRLEDRLMATLQNDDLSMHRLERMKQESEAIQQRLTQDKQFVERELRKLEEQRELFEAEVARREQQLRDEDFQRAIELLGQLKPRQARDMLKQLIAQGNEQQAVDYLAQMQPRKSAALLSEFKSPEELKQATVLLERLRQRGISMDSPEVNPGAPPQLPPESSPEVARR